MSNSPLDKVTEEQKLNRLIISAQHNSGFAQSIANNFVNTFAIFNAGGFAAGISVIPTDFGQEVIRQFPDASKWALGLFAAGFVFSTIVMCMLFTFSLDKYRFHRNQIAPSNSDVEASKTDPENNSWRLMRLGIVAIIMVSLTAIAVLSTLYIFLFFEIKPD